MPETASEALLASLAAALVTSLQVVALAELATARSQWPRVEQDEQVSAAAVVGVPH